MRELERYQCTFRHGKRHFGKIIKIKLEEIENKIRHKQIDFTAGKSCVVNLYTIQQIEKIQ